MTPHLIVFAVADDGLFPEAIARVDPVTGATTAAILLADPEREEWEAPEVEVVEDEEAFAEDEEGWDEEGADEVIVLG